MALDVEPVVGMAALGTLALAGLVLWACVHRPVVCYGCKEGNCFRHTGPD